MPIFRRELALASGPVSGGTRETWHLVLDTDAPGLYIEHKTEQAAAHSAGVALSDKEHYGINDFLMLAQGQPAQPALILAQGDVSRGDSKLKRPLGKGGNGT